MSKRGKKGRPVIDAAKILNNPVRVKKGDKIVAMSPMQAEYEHLAAQAINGCVKAMCRFVRDALRLGLIEKAEPQAEYPQRLVVPKDWRIDEFSAHFDRYGFPPWPGPRDGLTPEARALLNVRKRRTK